MPDKNAVLLIDKPHYRYWQALYLSLFSRKFYVDVGKRWRGLGLGYLLLLIAVASLPFAIRFLIDFNNFFQQQFVQPLQSLPLVYIQKGIVNCDEPMPYFNKNKQGQIVAIIDTTGTISYFTPQYPDLKLLILKDRILLRYLSPHFFFLPKNSPQNSAVNSYMISKYDNEIIDGKTLLHSAFVKKLEQTAKVMIFPGIIFIFYAICTVFLLAFSLMAQFIASLFFKLSITYFQACRLLIVSATPMIYLLLYSLTTAWFMNGLGLILLGAAAFYFCFAVISLKWESNKMVLH